MTPWTIGYLFDYSSWVTAKAAFLVATGGNMSGQGEHQFQANLKGVGDPVFPEDVDLKTTVTNTSNSNFLHGIGMIDKAGQIRDGIILDKNNVSTTTGVLYAAYGHVTNISCTNSGAASAHTKIGISAAIEGVVLDRVYVYCLDVTAGFGGYGIIAGYGSVSKNCIATDILGGNAARGFYLGNFGANIGVPEAYFCNANWVRHAIIANGFQILSTNAIVKNCITAGCQTAGYFDNSTPIYSNNISEDGTASGPGSLTFQDPITDVKWTNKTAGSENFLISDLSSVARAAGVNIPSVLNDFLNNTRVTPTFIGVHDLDAEVGDGGDHKGILRGVGVGVYRGVG